MKDPAATYHWSGDLPKTFPLFGKRRGEEEQPAADSEFKARPDTNSQTFAAQGKTLFVSANKLHRDKSFLCCISTFFMPTDLIGPSI